MLLLSFNVTLLSRCDDLSALQSDHLLEARMVVALSAICKAESILSSLAHFSDHVCQLHSLHEMFLNSKYSEGAAACA